MIIAIDTETRGLDTREFVLGCIALENWGRLCLITSIPPKPKGMGILEGIL